MEMNMYPRLADCEITFRDDYSRYGVKLSWEEIGALFHDLVTECDQDEMDKVCIDRVLDPFAAYFDRHEYIGDAEYDRFTEILKKIREECE